ncbi:hypothetical protein LMIY3S_03392 [Labrys miyagiensis]
MKKAVVSRLVVITGLAPLILYGANASGSLDMTTIRIFPALPGRAYQPLPPRNETIIP